MDTVAAENEFRRNRVLDLLTRTNDNNEQMKALTSSTEKLNDRTKFLDSLVTELLNRSGELLEENDMLKHDYDVVRRENTQLADLVDTLREEAEKAKQQYRGLEKLHNALEASFDDSRMRHRDLETTTGHLADQVKELHGNTFRLSRDSARSRNLVYELEHRNEWLQSQNAELVRNAQTVQQEHDRLRYQIQDILRLPAKTGSMTSTAQTLQDLRNRMARFISER